jgi:hypothetical protein
MELTPARKEELKGLCRARCTADGGKTSINYETTYREEICEECNADPNSSCTEARGARLAAGQAQTDVLIAKCEDRQSQSLLPVHLAIPIGGIDQVDGLPDYINLAYRYLVTVVLIVAIVMVVYGGFRYLVGASLGDIQAGKKIILDAIVGMLLVLGAYTILSTVNPATTILSLKAPEPIECQNLDIPEAVKNARCNSDSDCGGGKRCVEGRDYIYSFKKVAQATGEGASEGGSVGTSVGEQVAGFVGDGATPLVVAGVGAVISMPALVVLGAAAYLMPSSWIDAAGNVVGGEVGGATGATVGNAAATVQELRRSSNNIKVCSTLEQGSPCLSTQSCLAPLTCIESWSLCWTATGNHPGDPCDSDEQCSNGSCVFASPSYIMCPGIPPCATPGTPQKVCEIEVQDSTPCFRPNNGNSATVLPIQCSGPPLDTPFVCAFCPSGAEGSVREWTPLLIGLPFPAQCKPISALGTDCTR